MADGGAQHPVAGTDTTALPVVDIRGLGSDDPAERADVGGRLRAACRDTGFFYVTGHAVPPELVDAAFDQARRFFDLPLERKRRAGMDRSAFDRGYEELRGQTLEAGTPADLKEGFYLGRDGAAGKRNRWPEDLPAFRAVFEEYYAATTDLAVTLMRGLALSLDLPEDHFREFCADPAPTLRLVHYPPQPAHAAPGQKGAGEHTDWGAITVLAQDEVGGLEVLGERGWVAAPPVPGSFVVNLGDLMARWTNDLYRSTLHRVVNTSGRERYSMPLFFSGRPDHPVSCLPTCHVPGVPDRYPPTTPAEHTRERQRETYGAAGA
ncbi:MULTISPECIES: isopenicillin N synthase family dioxygenase [unclassified Blastococcus]